MSLKRLAAIILVATPCTGCRGGAPPGVEDVPGYHLRYTIWSGQSPGAGYFHTSLTVVDVDLAQGRARRLDRSASVPEPMLPHDDAGIAPLLSSVPWTDLPPERSLELNRRIGVWLATSPPPAYNGGMSLGHEDGHREELTVSWGGKTVVTRINPRGGWSPNDPLRVPAEWQDLLAALRAGVRSRIGELQPAKQ